VSFMGRLTRHAQRPGDLLPRPSVVNRAFHRIPLHAVGEPAEADDRRNRGGRVFGRGWHDPRRIPTDGTCVNYS